MFQNLKTRASRTLALVAVALMSAAVQAQVATDPITTMLNSIDLTGITVKVIAAGLVIVGIALAFKGPDVAKRVVRKV